MLLTKMNEQERIQRMQLPQRDGRIPLVIDTDAKNETDDQFAIAWALRSSERFSVEAVYAAPFCYDCIKPGIPNWNTHPVFSRDWTAKKGMEASLDEIKRIYRLLDLDDKGKVFRGAQQYLTDQGSPVESEAVRDLIDRARKSRELLYVAAIGAITNIASAILLAPDIVDKIVVIWLGGELPSAHHGKEFNMMQDVKASQTILDCGVPLIWIPCREVASALTLTRREAKERLAGKNPICDYLAQISLDMLEIDEKWGNLPQEEEHARIIWDIATVAALKNPAYVSSELISAPVLHEDLSVTEGTDRHKIRMVTACDRAVIFEDMYSVLLG